MKLHTRNGGTRVDFTDSELADTPPEPYGNTELALLFVLFIAACGCFGVFLYYAGRALMAWMW